MTPPSAPPALLTKSDLLEVRALKGIAHADVWEMLAACPVRVLAAGEILLHAGQANDRMHFVLDGKLSVRLRTATSESVATIERGGTVGELSVVDQKPATAFVVAEEPTRVLTLGADAFWKLTQASPEFARQMIVDLTAQVRRSTTSLVTSLDANVALEQTAMIDGLTAIHNRRGLNERGERFLRRASMGESEPLSLFMLDVDHFKKFNDNYGHPAGDAVLVAVAKCLVNCMRPSDFVARYGGEEFVVLLPKTNLTDARTAAERARIAVSEAEARGTDGQPLPRITISIGVAEHGAEADLAALIARADSLLYTAKKNGRNRVES